MIRDTRLLLDFAAVAQAGSFTRAARELGVAQPWLSTQVRKLEEQLAVRLFDRSTRRLELTTWGLELLAVAAPLRQHTNAALLEVASFAQRLKRTVRIGIPPSGADGIVQKVLGRLREMTGHTEVYLERGVSEGLVGRLEKGMVDLIFFMGSYPLDPKIFEVVALCPIKLHLLVDGYEPIDVKDPFRSQALVGRTLAIFPRALNPRLYDELTCAAHQAGINVGHFPELELQGGFAPSTPPSIRLALSTNADVDPAPPGWSKIPIFGLESHWLQLARLRENSIGVVRRALWDAALDAARASDQA